MVPRWLLEQRGGARERPSEAFYQGKNLSHGKLLAKNVNCARRRRHTRELSENLIEEVKALAAQADSLSSISGSCMVEKEN